MLHEGPKEKNTVGFNFIIIYCVVESSFVQFIIMFSKFLFFSSYFFINNAFIHVFTPFFTKLKGFMH